MRTFSESVFVTAHIYCTSYRAVCNIRQASTWVIVYVFIFFYVSIIEIRRCLCQLLDYEIWWFLTLPECLAAISDAKVETQEDYGI